MNFQGEFCLSHALWLFADCFPITFSISIFYVPFQKHEPNPLHFSNLFIQEQHSIRSINIYGRFSLFLVCFPVFWGGGLLVLHFSGVDLLVAQSGVELFQRRFSLFTKLELETLRKRNKCQTTCLFLVFRSIVLVLLWGSVGASLRSGLCKILTPLWQNDGTNRTWRWSSSQILQLPSAGDCVSII